MSAWVAPSSSSWDWIALSVFDGARTDSRRRVRLSAVAVAVLVLLTVSAPAAAATPPSLAAFVETAGNPPQATYARLRIPSIGVDAAVAAHLVPPGGGALPNPYGPADVAWYDLRQYPGLGGVPGLGGNAVFSGHVDYNATVPYAGVFYRGPAVFEGLSRVEQGDLVEVERGSTTYTYAVSWVQVLPEESPRWDDMLTARVPVDSVTLFTCTGDFNAATLGYSHRTVVRAERAEGTARVLPLLAGGEWGVGVSGVTHPALVARRQPYEVSAVYAQDPTTGQWLSYRPGAPAFVNTLLGHLSLDSFVIVRKR